MSNIDKHADSVSRIIADLKLKHGSGDTYAPIMRWDELLALLDELEAKDKQIADLKEAFRIPLSAAGIMSSITKEWLQKAISQNESMRDEIPFGWDEDDINMLEALRIALASMEAKSRKLFTCSGCGAEGLDEPLESKCHCNEDGAHWVESVVYTAPPAPVSVPDNRAITQHFDKIALETAREIMCDVNRRHEFLGGEVQLLSRIQCRIDDACRSAMLQGAEPVTTAYKLPDDFDFDRFNDVVWLEAVASNPHMHSPTTSTIAMVALELNRQLSDCNSPVIPDWQAQAEKRAELYGSSFVLFRNGESPQCADPTKVIISFTDEGLGHDSAAPQQEVK